VKGHKVDLGFEAPHIGEKAERAETVWPGDKGGLISVHKYLKGKRKDDGARLFSVEPSDRTRGSGYQLKHRKFPLNIGKHFFTVRVTEHWHRLPREVVESQSLEILKAHLDMVLGHWL